MLSFVFPPGPLPEVLLLRHKDRELRKEGSHESRPPRYPAQIGVYGSHAWRAVPQSTIIGGIIPLAHWRITP
jgi:hypothetical protein